jgi:hypothetical protein
MQGRNILDEVVILHEAVHKIHRKIEWGNFEIRFLESIRQSQLVFLQQTLGMKGFFVRIVHSHS